MSILSALCKEPEIACSPVLTDNVVSFNSILLQDPEEADKEGRELVDDTYECVNSLCQAQLGLDSLKKTSTVSALCKVLASRTYGLCICRHSSDLPCVSVNMDPNIYRFDESMRQGALLQDEPNPWKNKNASQATNYSSSFIGHSIYIEDLT